MSATKRTNRQRTAMLRAAAVAYGDPVQAEELPRKKNLRLHQSKIDEAKLVLGTATETETIEVALELVTLRQELAGGVRGMFGAELAELFAD